MSRTKSSRCCGHTSRCSNGASVRCRRSHPLRIVRARQADRRQRYRHPGSFRRASGLAAAFRRAVLYRGPVRLHLADLVVRALPLYIQEKVHPKALIDVLESTGEEGPPSPIGSRRSSRRVLRRTRWPCSSDPRTRSRGQRKPSASRACPQPYWTNARKERDARSPSRPCISPKDWSSEPWRSWHATTRSCLCNRVSRTWPTKDLEDTYGMERHLPTWPARGPLIVFL